MERAKECLEQDLEHRVMVDHREWPVLAVSSVGFSMILVLSVFLVLQMLN